MRGYSVKLGLYLEVSVPVLLTQGGLEHRPDLRGGLASGDRAMGDQSYRRILKFIYILASLQR